MARCAAPPLPTGRSEEGVIDTLVRHVQPGLRRVQKFVQAARDNLLDVRVRQFCAQLTEPLLGKISVYAEIETAA
jgi:hypothetical protein